MIQSHRKIFWSGIIFSVILSGIAVRAIPVSWDEGWNFCVARYWIEEGFFGCKYMGEPATARLANGPVTVGLAAAGFKLFGVGFLAGRFFTAALTIGLLLLLSFLTCKFFGKTAASYTPWIFCVISADQRINPIFLGGQAWGEIPSLVFFCLGILFLYYYRSSPLLTLCTLLLCPLLFSLAIFTKPQFLPFLLTGLTATFVASYSRRAMSVSLTAAVSVVACLYSSMWWHIFDVPLPPQASSSITTLPSLTSLLAINLDTSIRFKALLIFLHEGLFAVISLVLLAFLYKSPSHSRLTESFAFLLLLIVGVTWMGWFLLSSINFPRYLAPALVLLTPIVSFGVTQACARARKSNVRIKWMSFAAASLFVISNIRSISIFIEDFWGSNNDLYAVASFLNEKTPPHSVVETYETQLFYLTDRRLSYPSDLENFQSMLGQSNIVANYDPFRNNPDYVVLGLWSKHAFPFYTQLSEVNGAEVLEIGDFKIIRLPK